MNQNKLARYVRNRRCTLLGVGPMSHNCVDATIELANEHSVPLILIASRRQVECAEQGGGYVNGWTTESFARYVFDQDKRGKVMLARDHGGPWQSPHEVKERLGLRNAMDSAKQSFEADIRSGFEFVHIDPSIDIHSAPTVDEVLERIYELYEFCFQVARECRRELLFEIGTEEQGESLAQNLDDFEYVLVEITKFCEENRFPKPVFVVAQTGTKVMEDRNVGSFDSPFRIPGELPVEIQLPQIIDLCERYGFWLKEHNADYLSDESLRWHPKLKIHGVNVAPEFGLTETRALLRLLRDNGLERAADDFLELAHASRKWEKWLLPDTKLDREGTAILAGHYVFAHPGVVELKRAAARDLAGRGVDLEAQLKAAVKAAIHRYLASFNLLETAP